MHEQALSAKGDQLFEKLLLSCAPQDLLRLMGLPVVYTRAEAKALDAQFNAKVLGRTDQRDCVLYVNQSIENLISFRISCGLWAFWSSMPGPRREALDAQLNATVDGQINGKVYMETSFLSHLTRDLLQLMGLPVLYARAEAEALFV